MEWLLIGEPGTPGRLAAKVALIGPCAWAKISDYNKREVLELELFDQ
jgi:hypothetical protein